MSKLTSLRTLGSLTLLAALAACGGGGGGGGSDSPSTGGGDNGGSVDVVATAGTLQTSVAAATYGTGSLERSAFDALNTARGQAGAGLLAQHAQLDTAAEAHALYLTTNIASGISHDQDATKANFYAVTPADRIAKAGFAAAYSTEDIGGTGASMLGSDCVLGLLNTVYHAASLLSQGTHVGIGFGTDGAGFPLCVAKLASQSGNSFGQVPGTGKFIGYPYNGQTGVADTFFVGYEVPRPSAAVLPNLTAGTPVVVSVRNADFLNFLDAGTLRVTVTEFSLKDGSGNIIPAAILAPSAVRAGAGVTLTADAVLPQGSMVLVPLSPLMTGTTYTVNFGATLKTGGEVLGGEWSFTTN